MDPSLRNTPGLVARIERHRDELLKHFDRLVSHATIDRNDRNTTAITQYQMQIETASIIRAAEDLQVLIRQLQEMWLFGQLDTLGDSKLQQSTEENAEVVAGLLEQLADHQGSGKRERNRVATTEGVNVDVATQDA